MEYQKNFLERRHTEAYSWFRNFRIGDLEDDQAFYFAMMVMLGCDWCRSSSCTWHQRGSRPSVNTRKNGCLGFEWSGESIMWRCWYLYQISRKTRLQLFLLCTRCWRWYRLCTVRKEMKSTTIEKKTEIDTQESFFPVPHFLKKGWSLSLIIL